MDCGECVEKLAEFLEKDFDPALLSELSAHLEECDGCSKTRVEDALVRKVRDCNAHDSAPPALRERIIERIDPSR
jgi:anti-sigma factor (TIGR02949 family)